MGCPVSRWPARLRNSDRFLGRRKFKSYYTMGRKVGTGAFAQVRLCYHLTTGEECVVKIISKPYSAEDFALEVNLLRQVGNGSCPHVVRFFDNFEDNRYYYSVMEYCRGGDLFSVVANKPDTTEAVLSRWIRQILEGISHIHLLGIVHRDVKPQNLLFGDFDCTTVKIIDFGLSFQMQKGQLLDEPCGTPEFLSPEMVLGRYGRKVDIWSVGILCYILLFGCRPFVSVTDAELFREIVETEPSYVARNSSGLYNPTPEAVSFCKMLLQKNSRKRPTAVEALKHVWLTGVKQLQPGMSGESTTEIPSKIRERARAETTAIVERDRQRLQSAMKMVSVDSREGGYLNILKQPGSHQFGLLDTGHKEQESSFLSHFRKPQHASKDTTNKSALASHDEGYKRTRVNVGQYTVVVEEIDRLRAADAFYIPSEADNLSVGMILETADDASLVKHGARDVASFSAQPGSQVYAETVYRTNSSTSSSSSLSSSSLNVRPKSPPSETPSQWTVCVKSTPSANKATVNAAVVPHLSLKTGDPVPVVQTLHTLSPVQSAVSQRSQSFSSSLSPDSPLAVPSLTSRFNDADLEDAQLEASKQPLSKTLSPCSSAQQTRRNSSKSTSAEPLAPATPLFPDGGVVRFEPNGLLRPQAGLIVFEF